ncbi:MAG TPA: hypothetical protein VEU76_11050 [Candidatus Udaeobacter sp.]|nr:hypothetical protein [Candidatus Udaeobacter sp.]
MRRSNGNLAAAESGATEKWWDDVLAGEVAARHPVHGDELKVKLTDGRLILWGEVPTSRDRDQLVREARERIGRGLHKYDVSKLKVRPLGEKAGVLAQTLVAAFEHTDTADVALKFFLEHTRSQPIRTAIVENPARLAAALPPDLVDDARKQLDRGGALLVVEVDETEAFRARALLEEDTRSTWTVAAPPRVISDGRQ